MGLNLGHELEAGGEPMTRTLSFALIGLTAWAGPGAGPHDPVVSDGDKYQVVLENPRVRVLRYRDQPGAQTHLHHHPAFVLVALTAFRRQLTLPDGSKRERQFAAGDVAWMPAQDHVGSNVGGTPTEALLIEIKPD